MPARPPRNYTVIEVATALRYTPFYTRDLCRAGKIPGAHRMIDEATGRPSGQWLIDADAFDAWRQASIDKAAS